MFENPEILSGTPPRSFEWQLSSTVVAPSHFAGHAPPLERDDAPTTCHRRPPQVMRSGATPQPFVITRVDRIAPRKVAREAALLALSAHIGGSLPARRKRITEIAVPQQYCFPLSARTLAPKLSRLLLGSPQAAVLPPLEARPSARGRAKDRH